MCRYLYLASDAPLPLIEWEESRPAFNVAELQDYDLDVVKQFTKPHIVFLGAHTVCSCCFAYDSEPPEDEREEMEDRDARESVRELIQFLSDEAQKSPLELFACWNGDQGETPVETLTVSPNYFCGSEFPVGDEPTMFLINKT